MDRVQDAGWRRDAPDVGVEQDHWLEHAQPGASQELIGQRAEVFGGEARVGVARCHGHEVKVETLLVDEPRLGASRCPGFIGGLARYLARELRMECRPQEAKLPLEFL